MKKWMRYFIALYTVLIFFNRAHAANEVVVKSPDARISFRLFLQDDRLVYSIYFNQSPVILVSPLVFMIDGSPLTSGARIAASRNYAIDKTYPWLGVHAMAIDHCNGSEVSLVRNDLRYTIDIRVYNDGAAFRITAPGSATEERIPDEATVFTLPAGTTLWYHDLEMHYEGIHVKKPVEEVRDGEWVAPPATVKLPGNIYAAITEADLQHYSGFALQANGQKGLVIRLAQHQPTSYPYRLRYSPEDTARLKQPAAIKGVITTPWRVVMIGKDLDAMVNNDMVHDLCAPPDKNLFPQGVKTGWIRPGRAVWKYVDGGGDGTPEVMRRFTDEAAALGFEHNILEGFWRKWTDEQLRQLVNYSKQKKVGIWIWEHSRRLRSDTARRAFFKKCHDLGITGVKIDFFDHEAMEVVDLYLAILREAAENKLLVDFHGANKPTGLSRTWPNELTREAVKGMEASKLADRATHETTIPFTRFLAGPAEYTVMIFGDRKKNTTRAHQVASAAILSAPMLTYASNPDSILASPARNLISSIPAVWDETIVLPGSEIGELAAFARRKGTTWFIAVMNGIGPRHLKIDLRMLKGGSHKAMVVRDDALSGRLVVENKTFRSTDALELELVTGGGFIARVEQ